ncbi:Predicted glycosyl transferase [Pedobacter westerhofensis]|uniref:Predicted glycosyl transferase n=2 Tax=Pedobacter westerhofensis TaxID=425512 RepID=A0A521CX88_9SPHI|nr:Predicted glycosyl transferase [Pedobacter westerhofensis]
MYFQAAETIGPRLQLSQYMGFTTTSYPAICFYIHHHGAGHITRAISIAAAIKDFPVCFLGSNLKPYADLISSHIECIHLPMDVPLDDEPELPPAELNFLHYAPLGLEGIRRRADILTGVFREKYPMILVVDVSVEVTLLARLCGIPTVVMLQHGRRNDEPHRNAYQSAQLLIAPFSPVMASGGIAEEFAAKTFYSGGFSRYSNLNLSTNIHESPGHLAILTGKGGTSVDPEFIIFLANQCPGYVFHVIGQLAPEDAKAPDNIIWHGHQHDPLDLLLMCEIVIGNAGHNTVMEMADLNKRFICIPEERPFEEQEQKAALLAQNGKAVLVKASDLYAEDWPALLDDVGQLTPDWTNVINPEALLNIAEKLRITAEDLYLR